MKPTAYLSILFCLLHQSALYGQSRLAGGVVDEQGEGLAAVNVLLYASDSSLARAQISGATGQFRFLDLEDGDYRLEISGTGYATTARAVVLAGENLTLPAIQMEWVSSELAAVQITSDRPLIRVDPDKTVFNVAGNLSTTGDQALELLRKAPGVIVDQNDDLMVEGKSGVQIFVNGRPLQLQGEDRANYLRSLPADDIDAIEIITQPSSRYDAAGSAGIINIRLRREKGLGTNGTASAGLTYGQALRGNGSVNVNHRTKKVNAFGSYSNYIGESRGFIYLYRTQNGNVFDARTDSEYHSESHNFRAGADYFLDSRSTIGVLVDGNLRDATNESTSRTPIAPLGQTSPDSILFAPNRSQNDSYNLNANVNYHFTDTNGTTFNVDLDYGQYSRDRNNFQPNYYLSPDESTILTQRITSQNTPTDIAIMTAKMDYERNLLGGVLSTGIKWSDVRTDNTFEFFNVKQGEQQFDSSRSNEFEYLENINAAYVNYKASVGKWKLQGGLRAEQTISRGTLLSNVSSANAQVDRNYLNLFPSGGATYQAAPMHSFALLYSRRIQRPNYQSLNPFEFQLNELSFSRGNPFLQPQYTDNIKLSHTYRYSLTTSFSYSYVSDFFAKVTEAEGDNRNFLNTRNVADQETYSFSVSTPFPLPDGWSAYLSAYVYHNDFTATNPSFVSIDQTTFGMYAQTAVDLPCRFNFEVSGWYSSPSIWGGTYQTQSLGSLNLAAKKRFGENWTLKLALNDVLFTSPWRGVTEFGGVVIDGTGGGDSRQVRLNVSYRFGRDDVKSQRKRKMGLDSEAGRI